MKKIYKTLLTTIITLSLLAMSSASSEVFAARALNIVGDKNFSTNSLTPQVKTAHDAFKGYISGIKSGAIKPYPNPYSGATSGDLYTIGRVVGPYIGNLLFALRVTGDLSYLDEVANVMGKIEGTLDNSGGSPGLHWLHDKNNATYYNTKYNHKMDNQLTLATLVDATYAFHANRNNGSNYASLATKWTGILKAWEAKISNYHGLMHPYTQFTKYYFLMYKITGDSKYLTQFNSRQAVIQKSARNGNTPSGPSVAWDHFVVGDSLYPYGCHPNVYSTYTTQAMMTMYFEGAGIFADKSFMEKIMRTIKEDVFKGKYQNYDVMCDNNSSYGLTETSSGLDAVTTVAHRSTLNYAYFDTSGVLSSIINANPQKNSYNYYSWVMMSAARGGSVNPPTIPPTTPGPTVRPTATPSPTVRPTGTGRPSPSPSVRPTTQPTVPPSGTDGDANGDGRVDGIDYVIWLTNYKSDTTAGQSVGDFNKNNRVNMDDFVLWRSLYR